MYRVDRNNFYHSAKTATVETPSQVSQFIFDIIQDKIDRSKPVLDPCVGGELTKAVSQSGL